MNKKFFYCFLFFLLLAAILPAQEALKSVEEEYYDFLALQGLAELPTLNYRTLSDSVWNINEDAEHPWQNNNLGVFHPLFGDSRLRVYGPDLFMSYNTTAPYGQNDGVLWQGRGFNSSLKTGARFEGYGVEFTLLPHFAFSQNAYFDIMPSHYENIYGYFWGYDAPRSNKGGMDAPQRFGNKSFFDWDFGDSEIRYTWKTLTVGFGTQTIWLGPAYINPILHSNNAPAYPKFDIGLRRQKFTIPGLDWYAGDVELRLWVGRLTESDYFDNDDSNNYTMIHGLAVAYAPSFIQGLTIFANRVCLVPWEWANIKYILPSNNNIIEDQKSSLGFSWLFPQVGFVVFSEIGIDDHIIGGMTGLIRHPFHATSFNIGFKKTLNIKPEKKLYGEIIFEFNWLEMTQDFQLQWPYSIYFHHLITQGYTNKGQLIGNGSSPGGNAQQLSFVLYYPKGNSILSIGRNNPDSNFIYSKAVYYSAKDKTLENGTLNDTYFLKNKANFLFSLNTNYFITSEVMISGGMTYNLIINPQYHYDNKYNEFTYLHNFSFQAGVKVNL